MTQEAPPNAAPARDVLLETLGQEEESYRLLADLAEQEHSAILSGSAEALAALLVEKERVIERLMLLEARRAASLGEFASAAGVPADTLTLRSLVDLWDVDEERERIRQVRESLDGHVRRLAAANQRNASLLRSSLIMLARWINLVTGQEQVGATYTRRGRRGRRAGAVAVNREV